MLVELNVVLLKVEKRGKKARDIIFEKAAPIREHLRAGGKIS